MCIRDSNGTIPVLVASDIAARGLDIDEIRLVVNYDIPGDPDTYVHRIGRTGRAGASGRAITFVTSEDREALRDIEKRIGRAIPVLGDAPAPVHRPVTPPPQPRQKNQASQAPRSEGRSSQGSGEGRGRNSRRGRSGGSEGAGGESRQAKAPEAGRGRRDENRQGGRRGEQPRNGRRDDRRDAPGRRDSKPGNAASGSSSESHRTPSGKPIPKLSQPGEGGLVGRLWRKIRGS